MTKPEYTPVELAQRLDEIRSSTGKPYNATNPAEHPAVHAAMLLENAPHPQLSEDSLQAIGAALHMAIITPPKLARATSQKIDTQLRLQSAPQPQLNETAFNRIEAQLHAYMNAGSQTKDALRIEQRSSYPLWSMVASVTLALIGVALIGATVFNNGRSSGNEQAASTEQSGYTSEMQAIPPDGIPIDPTAKPNSGNQSQTGNMNVERMSTESLAAKPPPILGIADVLNLPPAVVIEGPITAIEDTLLYIYAMPFDLGYDPAPFVSIGDIVSIQGAVNPVDANSYLILSMTLVTDASSTATPLLQSGSDELPVNTSDINSNGD